MLASVVVDRRDDRWREAAGRLIADTSLLDAGFERDVFGQLGPSKQMGAYVLEAGRLVTSRLEKLAERLDILYGDQLDTDTRERLHAAREQLQATVEALTRLPEAIDANYRL